MLSARRRTRELLVQALYGRCLLRGDFDRDIFFDTYFDEKSARTYETVYFNILET
jgi:hypothetical protein